MLSGKWSLGDVDDVEDLVTRTALAELVKRGVTLKPADLDDLLAFLLECAWVEWGRFDPDRGLKFSTYLRQQTKLRYLDYVRKVRGRTSWKWSDRSYHREPRQADLSLDAVVGDGEDTLGELIAARSGDDEADRLARNDAGLQAAVDLHAARDLAVISDAADAWIAGRHPARVVYGFPDSGGSCEE